MKSSISANYHKGNEFDLAIRTGGYEDKVVVEIGDQVLSDHPNMVFNGITLILRTEDIAPLAEALNEWLADNSPTINDVVKAEIEGSNV